MILRASSSHAPFRPPNIIFYDARARALAAGPHRGRGARQSACVTGDAGATAACSRLTLNPSPPDADSLDAVLATLTETPWDATLAAVLGPRDALYAHFRVDMPEARMGCSAQDAALAAGHKAGGAAAQAGADDAENFDSYGALARDAGY